ncbi:hypothetical protein QN277_019682 [Acacia crassicarpa]|uniref:Uncharacterized protein n=1 Tax=Acacia crassicarpa TaxID=499986 RepID=A0AAE1JMC7_9FABA|nr:hypothetical protein QN277_019682 [Acacia crassicarpa]
MDAHRDPLVQINDFQLHDFIDDTNFDQFINLLHRENEHSFCNFDSDLINVYLADTQFLPLPANPFESNNAVVNVYDPTSTLSSFSCFDGKVKGGRGEEENDSSTATTNTTTKTTTRDNAKHKSKTDRSKTLISERRRRG